MVLLHLSYAAHNKDHKLMVANYSDCKAQQLTSNAQDEGKTLV